MKTNMTSSENLAALRWSCRRGMLELDLLLGRFLDKVYETLSPEEDKLFRELLDETDPDLYSWLLGNTLPAREEWLPLLQKIRGFSPCSSS